MELNEDCHDSVDVLDTATTTIVHDTLDDDSFDTQSISSNASGKKPLYKRAWRKVSGQARYIHCLLCCCCLFTLTP